jgi:hypothetical protein
MAALRFQHLSSGCAGFAVTVLERGWIKKMATYTRIVSERFSKNE